MVAQVQTAMHDAIVSLSAIPDPVWEMLAKPIKSCDWPHLKSEVFKAGQTQLAFINTRTLKPASELLWRLTHGYISSRLWVLKLGDEPDQPTARNIYNQFRMGDLEQQVVEGCR